MINIKMVADEAEIITNGYAFTKCEIGYRVLNLNRPDKAIVLSGDGDVLETTMDDIEMFMPVTELLQRPDRLNFL